jgi:tRNA1Val (adenine37-N6)-methyltransferase
MSGSRDNRHGGGAGGALGAPPARRAGKPGEGSALEFASLRISQPERGYRFTVDPVLLARFAAAFRAASVLDLGTGSGVLLLLLARLLPDLSRGTGIELQEELFLHAERNFRENGLDGILRAVHGDLRGGVAGEEEGSFDLVVSNPPFRRAGEGRRNPDPQKEIARHEVACTLPELLRTARTYLRDGGILALVHPAARTAELLGEGRAAGFAPVLLRFVHPFAGKEANRLLAAFRKGGRGRDVRVMAPLVEYAEAGRYHPEVVEAFGGLLRK